VEAARESQPHLQGQLAAPSGEAGNGRPVLERDAGAGPCAGPIEARTADGQTAVPVEAVEQEPVRLFLETRLVAFPGEPSQLPHRGLVEQNRTPEAEDVAAGRASPLRILLTRVCMS